MLYYVARCLKNNVLFWYLWVFLILKKNNFTAPKSVIRAKDPRLQQIIVAEHGFFLPRESSTQRAVETKEGGGEVQEQVIELD